MGLNRERANNSRRSWQIANEKLTDGASLDITVWYASFENAFLDGHTRSGLDTAILVGTPTARRVGVARRNPPYVSEVRFEATFPLLIASSGVRWVSFHFTHPTTQTGSKVPSVGAALAASR